MTVPRGATPTTLDVPLSGALRSGTREEHERAERAAFVGMVLDGRLTRAAYVDWLVQLRQVYLALEDPRLGLPRGERGIDVFPAALARVSALEADLSGLAGNRWRAAAVRPAARTYADAIRAAMVEDGGLGYVAHAYTRYLGDLSGGRVLRSAVRRHLGLAEDVLTFYAFPGLDRSKLVKDTIRARLDTLPLTAGERNRLLTEARRAFDHNAALLAELGAAHGAEAVTSVGSRRG